MFENDAGTVSTIDSINGATFSTSATTQGQSLTNHFRTVIRQHVIKSEHTVTDTGDYNTELIGGDKEMAVSTSETLKNDEKVATSVGLVGAVEGAILGSVGNVGSYCLAKHLYGREGQVVDITRRVAAAAIGVDSAGRFVCHKLAVNQIRLSRTFYQSNIYDYISTFQYHYS